MHYEVIFDIAAAGYRSWWFPTMGAVFTGFLALAVRHYVKRNSPHQLRAVFLTLLTMLSALWTVAVFAMTFSDYYGLKRAIADGRGDLVEGVVTHFSQNSQKGAEKFCVRNTCFQYSAAVVTAGFNTTGLIRDGLQVRVTHVGGTIARLEVCREGHAPASTCPTHGSTGAPNGVPVGYPPRFARWRPLNRNVRRHASKMASDRRTGGSVNEISWLEAARFGSVGYGFRSRPRARNRAIATQMASINAPVTTQDPEPNRARPIR